MLPQHRHALSAATAVLGLLLLTAVPAISRGATPAAAAVPQTAVRVAPPVLRSRHQAARSQPGLRPGCDGRPGWRQVRGEQAATALGFPLSTLGYRVRFRPEHAGYTGLTDARAHTIDLFIRPCSQQSDASLLFTLAHEVGHAIDATHLRSSRHDDWLQARNRPGAVWFGCGGCADFTTGAGDFAETFAYWCTRNRAEYRSSLAPLPTDTQLARLSPMFAVTY